MPVPSLAEILGCAAAIDKGKRQSPRPTPIKETTAIRELRFWCAERVRLFLKKYHTVLANPCGESCSSIAIFQFLIIDLIELLLIFLT